VGLERDPLSLVSTTEELLSKIRGSGLGNRVYGKLIIIIDLDILWVH
jgi:hypothetical protein